MSPQNVVLRLGSLELSCWPSGHKPAHSSPAQPSQPRHPSVHLQTAAGEAAVSLFMETRADGSRYYQHQIRAAPVQCAGHILPVTTLSLVTTHHSNTAHDNHVSTIL